MKTAPVTAAKFPLDVSLLLPALGNRRALRPLGALLNWVIGTGELGEVYLSCSSSEVHFLRFVEDLLRVLHVEVPLAEDTLAELRAIPGPLIFVANHPFGLIEALALIALMGKCRSNVKILGNYLLGRLPELNPIYIPVDPFAGLESKTRNLSPLRVALAHLKDHGSLGIFPSGEVASIPDWRSKVAVERPWHPHVGALALRSGATVVPVCFEGQNSAFFQYFSLVLPKLRLALLPRETMAFQATLKVTIGKPLSPAALQAFGTPQALTEALRLKTTTLNITAAHVSKGALSVIAPPQSPVQLSLEIDQLASSGKKLLEEGDFEVYLFKQSEAPALLKEIGRLREVSFRAEGEGTGRAEDLDSYDRTYSHLLVWDRAQKRIAGAYRLGFADQLLPNGGASSFYMHTLFALDHGFLAKHPDSVELGRSFIALEYQKEFLPLHLLWQGIGRVLQKSPQYRYLFGPVSISPDFPSITQNLLIRFLRDQRVDPDLTESVRPRRKFQEVLHSPLKVTSFMQLQKLVQDFVDPEFKVPPLLKHYFRLGGKILGFNVDPDFRDTVDCFFLVDLNQANPKMLDRYLGRIPA